MAAELVGGAFLSSLFGKLFDKLDSPEYLNFFRGLKLNDRLLKKLKIMLCSANQVMDDAELKQFTNPNAREWLFELKEAICVAEELLDDINYEILRYEVESKSGSSFKKLKSSLSSSCTTFDQAIQEILDMLEYIVKQKKLLGLKQGVRSIASQRLPASLADESSVYGRNDDKEKIMELLLSDNGSSSDKISVIPITGMGGIGKTTLAQLVYDETSVEQFPIRSWVTVSDDSTSSEIAKRILAKITPDKPQIEEPNQLQHAVKEALMDKRFLLVLDDVWDESYPHLEPLMSCFHSGARGSWIIVTTRSDKVADKMGNLPTYHLKTVSDDECWKLFADRAFINASSETYPELQAIGRDIVKKCNGVPLAVKSLAGLLCSVLDPKGWNEILNSSIWEPRLRGKLSSDILPSLWLSYHYLPSHLKRCFAYCSMFPKDYEMNELRKKEVILLWMAEGLLQCPGNEEKRFEDVGEEYFQDLISRSLFQPLGKDKSTILMHDLIHDLAVFVSGEFSIRLDCNVKAKFSSKTRHFSYSTIEDYEKFDEVLSHAKRIRSFLQLPSRYYHCESPGRVSLLKTLLRVGGCLRALCLSQFGFTKLPDSIGNLKHLRYLDLSNNYDLEEIPSTLCGLYNLQTLRLSGCNRLTQLPTDMGNLVNLRHLDIERVPLQKMPPKMRNLKDLQTLGYFVIGENGGSSIEELGGLRFLSGALEISGLQNVDGVENVRESYLKDTKFLSKLACRWRYNDRSDDSRKDKEVLDALRPHPNLRELVIDGYGYETLPSWLGHCSYKAMVSVRLTNCYNCRVLPPLGKGLQHLIFLKKLSIEYCGNLQCLSENGLPTSLTSLYLDELPKLEDLGKGGLQHLISLEQLVIGKCENLRCLSENGLPTSLTSLDLEKLPKLEDLGKGGLQHLISLKHLSIDDCGNLQCLSENGLPTSLTCLIISDLPSLEDLGKNFFQHHIHLEKLSIYECKNLKYDSQEEDNVKGGLKNFISLKDLKICDSEKLLGLLEGGMPPSLTSLWIYGFQNLKYLNRMGFQHLISHSELRILNCGNLQCLPEQGLPSSLSLLHIRSCPLLEPRCQEGTGSDWPKISHIRHVYIE